MAVYYKFKSAKDYDTIAFDGHFISVGHLKEKIFESKHLGRGTDFDLVVTNAQTNEEYLDEGMLIPKNTSVLIRRVPGRPRMPIVTAPITSLEEPKVEDNTEGFKAIKSSYLGADSSAMEYTEDREWDEFGNDLYAIPEPVPVQSSNLVNNAPHSKDDEDGKIKALIETPTLEWQRQSSDGFGLGRGFGRGMGGRMIGGRGFGRGGFERKTPPSGYVCYRCKVAGHFIQHCPTNGDPNFDIRRVKPPTGIPKSMLIANPDGSYALPSGAVAVLKPNEAAFEKEIEGMPSTRSVGDLPPELRCPFCKEVMKDAVLTSKCCLKSFCDKCIRDHIISKSMCVCGATNILADDLLPNKTLRDTINRIMESNNSSAENGGSAFQVRDMESLNLHLKVSSPTQSVASKGEQVAPAPPPQNEEISKIAETAEDDKVLVIPDQKLEKVGKPKVTDASEAMHESLNVKEPVLQVTAPLADEEVQKKLVYGDAGKKKIKKKIPLPHEMQWRTGQDLATENYLMPMGPCAYNPYWMGTQPGMEAFIPPYAGPTPFMGYGLGHMDVAFGGFFPPDPFAAPGCVLPYGPPHRDLPNIAMGFNAGKQIMSREDFEARKVDLRRKRETDRELPEEREYRREVSSTRDVSSMKSTSKSFPPPPSGDHLHHRHRPERSSPDRHSHSHSRDPELLRPSSGRKSDYDDNLHHHRDNIDDYQHQSHRVHRHDYLEDRKHRDRHGGSRLRHSESSSAAKLLDPPVGSSSLTFTTDQKQKPSVFARISFPEKDVTASKKRKLSSSTAAPVTASTSRRASASNGHHEEREAAMVSRKSSVTASASVEYESSDDDRHFKRRPSRYTSPPSPAAAKLEGEERPRHSRRSRERERDRDRYSKHG